MVIVVYGTTGELIKLLPLLNGIDADSVLTVCTYQQPQQLKKLFSDASLEQPDFKIGQSETSADLEKLILVPRWMVGVWYGFLINRKRIKTRLKKEGSQKHALIVHGDTTTTLFGSLMGRFLGLPVIHIEAGLRSYNWRHPFPEELNRIYTSKIARIHFAPGNVPVSNLKKARTKGEIINTEYNTVLDSLRLAQKQKVAARDNLPLKYCLVSIHRNELLTQPKELKAILEKIRDFADTLPIIFLDHPITKERIQSLGFDGILEHSSISRLPKLSYFNFIKLLTQSSCVITDSGGLQEETAYLGIPCLVHRKATEREEGLGKNVLLSMYDSKKIDEFLEDYESYQTEGVSGNISPTEIIIEYLKESKFI
jgi:UDP-N-acetylglucosamine 2-epimerase (non-hydrolysing)